MTQLSSNPTAPLEPDVVIRFADSRRELDAGETLSASVSVLNADQLECRSAEVSVVWRTVGKGDEDLEVHFFERLLGDAAAFAEPYLIEATLPDSPLSYDGVSVKICWSVRLRLSLGGYRTHVTEAPFRLGAVGAPQAKAPA
ncbi:hypothetical protein Pla123a_29690 [Posidoniimonas polymericola]|uniref:Arrestin-like N-terminal domain-containing protein n=1 Tax=Posidoniimonas polymericola TaxID=2528002 RepID=A0A5C5YKL9_9BACT|nr:hypothetical protein [Posidoniimonas polymericola]TWT75460.1 hypothetical protein Pla123a_29690 [Posidoniimonas polymericola]